jgi:predicted fused transcriptional regulator/phosphomethylpyrimidine kinase
LGFKGDAVGSVKNAGKQVEFTTSVAFMASFFLARIVLLLRRVRPHALGVARWDFKSHSVLRDQYFNRPRVLRRRAQLLLVFHHG